MMRTRTQWAVLLGLVPAVWLAAVHHEPTPVEPPTQAELAAAEQQRAAEREARHTATQRQVRIVVAEDAVRAVLRAPDTAVFQGSHQAESGAVCGFVNAENGYGGMSGLQPYVTVGGLVLSVGDAEDYNANCT